MDLPIFPSLVCGGVTMDKIVSSLIISYLLNGTNVVQSLWKMHFITVTPSSVSFPNSYSRMFPSLKHVVLSHML